MCITRSFRNATCFRQKSIHKSKTTLLYFWVFCSTHTHKHIYTEKLRQRNHSKHAFAINLILCSVNYCFIMSFSLFFTISNSISSHLMRLLCSIFLSKIGFLEEISPCAISIDQKFWFRAC